MRRGADDPETVAGRQAPGDSSGRSAVLGRYDVSKWPVSFDDPFRQLLSVSTILNGGLVYFHMHQHRLERQ